MAFALKMGLKTRQIDFDNVFVWAELSEKDSIHCTLRVGVEHPTHFNRDVVLKLMKSLNGMQDAPKFWFFKAKKGLRELGFEPSEHDQCLFLHKEKKILLLLCVDDCMLFCEDNNGAIALAHKPGVTSRTKHICTKHWFFKDHIGEDSGIKLVKVDTEEQLADIFTKGVEEKSLWNARCTPNFGFSRQREG